MTTRSIVPNGDGEGSLGTASLKWGKMYSSDPASGENSGQVPTTAWVQKLVAEALKTAKNEIYKQAKLDAHPVGSYYWSNDSTSPATLFGGTWESLPAGYTLIAQGSGSDSFGSFTYEAGKQYGERKHQLTIDEMPSHHHQYDRKPKSFSNTKLYDDGPQSNCIQSARAASNDEIASTLDSGGNIPHNNIQPVVAGYCWCRTA